MPEFGLEIQAPTSNGQSKTTAFTAGHFELEGSNSLGEGQDSPISMEESVEMPSFS